MEERLNEIIKIALDLNASDIHITERFNEVVIDIRCDGKLKRIKKNYKDQRLIRYLQYLANLDVGTPLKPATGSFEIQINGLIIPVRFSYLNNLKGIYCVLRLLKNTKQIELDDLSKEEEVIKTFKKIITKRTGLVLLSGPTGSGKTTTLYSILRAIKNKAIYSIEDPVEIIQDNIVQISINEAIGYGYGDCIKQILRHDPDVLMIGEIRDELAAKMAVRAANTGHLVFSTIHASSAANCIYRMLELGVNEENLYDVLILLSNQILVNDGKNIHVYYELMDEEEIAYFRKYKKNSKSFISLDSKVELDNE